MIVTSLQIPLPGAAVSPEPSPIHNQAAAVPAEPEPFYKIRFEDTVSSQCKMLAASSAQRLHVIDTRLATRVPEIIQRWPRKVVFSHSLLGYITDDIEADQAILKMSKTCTVSLDSSHRDWGSACLVMATTAREARRTHDLLVETFGIPRTRADNTMPTFMILTLKHGSICSRRLNLANCPALDEETLDLSYGDGFHRWAQNLKNILFTRDSSLTLLQGPPGTGKTTFLRWLIGQTQGGAEFYFVPATCIGLIADPGFTHFWLQACGYSKGPKVLLIEDAETLLMTRGPDNGHWVGNLLNLTDGIMGDNMRFQIICTINCPLDAIDPALRRPGRLAASWIFRRLDRERAQKLANLVGKQLPDGTSFALSDIYSAAVQGEVHTRAGIGFGVRA